MFNLGCSGGLGYMLLFFMDRRQSRYMFLDAEDIFRGQSECFQLLDYADIQDLLMDEG